MLAIKGIKMPKCCGECDFECNLYECSLPQKHYKHNFTHDERSLDCPLIEIEEQENEATQSNK